MFGQEAKLRLDGLHVAISKSLIAPPTVPRSKPVRHVRQVRTVVGKPNPTAAIGTCVYPIVRAFQERSLLCDHDFQRGAANRRGTEACYYGAASYYFRRHASLWFTTASAKSVTEPVVLGIHCGRIQPGDTIIELAQSTVGWAAEQVGVKPARVAGYRAVFYAI